MKHPLSLLLGILILFSACKQSNKVEPTPSDLAQVVVKDSITVETEHGTYTYAVDWYKDLKERYHTDKDTVYIRGYEDYMEPIAKKEYNDIVDGHPEFFQEKVVNPYDTFYKISDKSLPAMSVNWYFYLYAHFLEQRYDSEKYKEESKKIHSLYNIKIGLFFPAGASGSWHTQAKSRKDALVAFNLYELSKYGMTLRSEEEFKKEKKEYMDKTWESLEEYAADQFGVSDLIESGVYDFDKLYKNEKEAVEALDRIITNSYYLDLSKNMKL